MSPSHGPPLGQKLLKQAEAAICREEVYDNVFGREKESILTARESVYEVNPGLFRAVSGYHGLYLTSGGFGL